MGGLLPGMSMGVNAAIAYTVNAVFPSEPYLAPGALPRYFINRDILGAQTVEDAIARATPAACSSGFSLNLLTRGTPTDGVNIEVGPGGMLSTFSPLSTTP